MYLERLGRIARVLRVRERLTQESLAARAGVSRRAVSMLERNQCAALRLGTIDAIFRALGGRLDLRPFWNGPELDRLLDAAHSAVAASLKRRLERWRWVVKVEVSYSRYGERGRIDLVAWHPATRVLVVLEIKTDLIDAQDLLGSLDSKSRLARHVVAPFGWDVSAVVPAIVFVEDRTIRNRLARVDVLFDRFSVRGRAATAWMRSPSSIPSGLLWFTSAGVSVPSRSAAPRVRRAVDGVEARRDSKIAPSTAH